MVRRVWRRGGSQVLKYLLAFSIAALATVVGTSTALAGHTFDSGDCWRNGTPKMCRGNWDGANTILYIDLVDQMNNATLHSHADTAKSNWSNANGPQWYIWRTGSLVYPPVYLKINNDIVAPNGRARNYDLWGNPCFGACVAFHSDIEVPEANQNYSVSTAIFAHEMGHTLGLYEHNVSGENALMTQGTTLTSPTSIDIGPNPPCSPGTNYLGIRCVYNWSN